MSNEGFKVQASIKDNDGDMVNFRADSNAELEAHLLEFPYGAYAQAKASLRGAAAVSGIVQPQQQAAPAQQPQAPVSNGWGGQPQQQAAAPQQQYQQPAQQQARPSQFAGPPHPEGKQCEAPGCGKVLEMKKTSTGKGTFRCPEWRWNNGQQNGHSQEWMS